MHAIGHGIDVDALPCVPERRPPLRRLLGLGRYAPVKGWETVLRALPELPDATLTLHGPMLTDADRAHRPRLERLADELAVHDRVTFGDEIAYAEVPHLFGLADAVVNATRGNAADKVVYEAAAACLPVFAASPVFDTLLPGAAPLPRRLSGLARGEDPRLRGRRRPRAARARRRGALGRPLGRPCPRDRRRMKPRVLFVSRERFRLPLDGAQKRKWDAVAEVVDHRVLAAAPAGSPTRDERFHLVGPAAPRILDGALYYLLLPWRIARELRGFRPEAALVQGIHETVAFLIARRLTGSRTKVILDVQGDWHEATRLYGSPLRRLLEPGERRARAGRGAPRRRGTHRLDADDGARHGARRPAGRGVPVLRRRRGVPRAAARAAAGEAARGLRRRARALQGVRHARRGVAPRRAAGARTRRCTSSATERCATARSVSSPISRSRRSGRRG